VIAALAGGLAVAAGGAVWVLRRRYLAVRVHGPSMQPTLRSGQLVLARRTRLDRVRRGQLVVVAFPPDPPGVPPVPDNPRWLIKRAAALPGDPVPAEVHASGAVPDATVPAGRLIVLGDNSAASFDSRRAGYFPGDALFGVVVRIMRS
jgi:signal peptidase I